MFALSTTDDPSASDWEMLKKAVKWFKRRTEVRGNMEEGWFANAKVHCWR